MICIYQRQQIYTSVNHVIIIYAILCLPIGWSRYSTLERYPPDRQVLSRVTRKVLSNSKHTLLCLYGHNILARINLIPLETLQRFAQWLEAQSLQGTAHSVSLLASIYIEGCFESASHNFYFLVRCKIKL